MCFRPAAADASKTCPECGQTVNAVGGYFPPKCPSCGFQFDGADSASQAPSSAAPGMPGVPGNMPGPPKAPGNMPGPPKAPGNMPGPPK